MPPTYYLEYDRHLARLHRCCRAYTPTSNTASHDNHEKIKSWVPFVSYMGMELCYYCYYFQTEGLVGVRANLMTKGAINWGPKG